MIYCTSDLIVGAPFEGQGCVYVFRGSARGLHVDYSQRIAAADLPLTASLPPGPPGLSAFGYSLSAGLDVDDNGYPDLAVGAFQVLPSQLGPLSRAKLITCFDNRYAMAKFSKSGV